MAEPRCIHFSYPPYYPAFFIALGEEVERRGDPISGWMADVPAGAAWYAGQRVWAQPLDAAVPVVVVIPLVVKPNAFDADDMVATEPFRVLQTNLNRRHRQRFRSCPLVRGKANRPPCIGWPK
ncbi:MAG: hypothetical protein J6386_11960 [Candidatus Synoicihabitans palmerolidicus]|nr:hypothetical protein [Candidatus Synoicihabitans palmerolidicus]